MSDNNDPSPPRTDTGPETSPPPSPSQPSAAHDHPASDVDPPTTSTVPTAHESAPAPTTEPFDAKKVYKKQSFIRYAPSAYNTFAYQPSIGKDLATLLVDESGMAPRFHLLSPELFLASIDVNEPTADDYKKFKTPDLAGKKKEHELYSELAAVVQSVLDAAECDVLRFLDTANHKAKDGNSGKKETFNDGGIYKNSPLAREATEFTDAHRERSKISPDDIARRLLGLRSWNWIDILFELKMSEDLSAFYFKTKPRGYKKLYDALAAQCAQGKATDPSSEGENCSGDLAHAADDGDASGDGAGREAGQSDGIVGREDEEDDSPELVDATTPPKEKSVAHKDPSIADAARSEDVPAGDEEVEPGPGLITLEVPPFVKLSDKGKNALGQFVEYMLNVQKNQHRVFSYSVYICYDMARLFCFDRSGAFASQPFRWDKPDSFLHQFVWKIAQLARAGRFAELGHDETASLASDEQKDKFLALKDDTTLPQHVRDGFKKAAADKWPIYKLEVTPGEPSEDEWFDDIAFPPPKEFGSSPTGQPQPSSSHNAPPSKPSSSSDPLYSSSDNPPKPDARYFLVGRPHFAADGLVGRCTRGYFAYDVTDADEKNWRVCFLKDFWRPVVPGRTRPEHLVYQRLRYCGVERGIGTLICGGDVGGHWAQRTQVQKFLPEENRPVLRVHYRLVIEEIGIPLKDFDSFPELSAIFVDVIKAHHKAWTRAHVLHRDISVGNIMILPRTGNSRRKGMLIDWDLSRLECELGSGPVEPDRTGTWQFRSALSLRYPWKPYRRSDDIESFIHVYLYLVLRFHPVNDRSLKELVTSLFEGVSLVHGIKTGGDRKLVLFSDTRDEPQIQPSSNPSLQNLVQDIISGCSRSYRTIDRDAMERCYGFAQFSGLEQSEPRSELPHHTSAGIVDFESDDDEIPRAETQLPPNSDSPSIQTAITAPTGVDPKDPCVVEGFLSEVGNLLDLLKRHAATPLSHCDKARDQFPARKHEDIYRGPTYTGNQRIGSQSTSGTLSTLGSPFNFGSRNGPISGTFFGSKKRMRIASGSPATGATATAVQGSSDAVHRTKRAK